MTFLDPLYILAILLSITIHEVAHGLMARRLGDPTAHNEGRLTLNPLAHLDPLGALMFVLIGFGWAKPVPVDPRYFHHPKRDMALTALAGPVSNLILAFVAFVLLALLENVHGQSAIGLFTESPSGSAVTILLARFLGACIFLNLALMAFNLLPIAPLDGSKILQRFIPIRYEYEYEMFMQRGPYILFFILIAESFTNISILSFWVHGISNSVLSLFQMLPL